MCYFNQITNCLRFKICRRIVYYVYVVGSMDIQRVFIKSGTANVARVRTARVIDWPMTSLSGTLFGLGAPRRCGATCTTRAPVASAALIVTQHSETKKSNESRKVLRVS